MKRQYSLRLNKIEEALRSALPPVVDSRWLRRSAGVDEQGVLESYENIVKPARDLIERGGKRWRPMLMQLACELVGGADRSLPLAPLVELPHNGSLIIDDIEDRADWRRGGPSIHVIYGEDMAINSGNLLYFLPTVVIDDGPFTAEEKALFYRYYTEDMRRLHFGQGLDIQWHRDHAYTPSRSEYLQMCRFKTGSLARLAARLGVAAGGGSGEQAERLGLICEEMGVAFQILDDVKNLTEGNPGKRRGDDIVEGKKSLPVIIHLLERPEGAERIRSCFERAEAEGPESQAVEEAIALLEGSKSIEAARAVAEQMRGEATAGIRDGFGAGEARDLIVHLFEDF